MPLYQIVFVISILLGLPILLIVYFINSKNKPGLELGITIYSVLFKRKKTELIQEYINSLAIIFFENPQVILKRLIFRRYN